MTLNPNSKSEEELMKRAIPRRLAIAVMAFCLPLVARSASAQQERAKEPATAEQKPVVAYRIEFNVREIEDGKRLNSRNYVLMAEDGNWGKVRVGSKVQWRETRGEGFELHYQDVGMNIDCRPREQGGSVALDIHVEWTGVAPPAGADPTFGDRLFRTDRAEVQSIVTLGKPTLVASMDDTESNRRYEIEVTATKVK
jgi:hypothetical protein